MPGFVYWGHRRFHAYYPMYVSYSGLLAEILCQSIAQTSFSWVNSNS